MCVCMCGRVYRRSAGASGGQKPDTLELKLEATVVHSVCMLEIKSSTLLPAEP